MVVKVLDVYVRPPPPVDRTVHQRLTLLPNSCWRGFKLLPAERAPFVAIPEVKLPERPDGASTLDEVSQRSTPFCDLSNHSTLLVDPAARAREIG